ncbi:MAG: ATP-binding cassette domain-containing protein, partial [Pseudomonadota bacterium]|nr:ATP-binding cassette domain-containing protein [Pseudomonadota bacterium]
MLTICDLVIHRGGRTLLDGVSLSLPTGTRCALIGRNGSGKTSLLNVLAGRLHPDGGSVEIGSGARVGMVAQDAPSGLLSLRETVLAADTERAALLVEAETATDPERIAFIHIRLADIDASGAPARAARILAGLGFDEETQNRPVDSLSGGWRMRVALAALLFRRPEILLLDEPTNHLDLEASIWLESFLKSYPNTLILVSHDRDLLNSVPAVTLHLDGGQLVRYRGGYDAFTRVRAERMAFRSAQASRVDAERKRIQGFVDRFRVKAT